MNDEQLKILELYWQRTIRRGVRWKKRTIKYIIIALWIHFIIFCKQLRLIFCDFFEGGWYWMYQKSQRSTLRVYHYALERRLRWPTWSSSCRNPHWSLPIIKHWLLSCTENSRRCSLITQWNILSPSVPGPENGVYLVLFRAVSSGFCGRNKMKRTGWY